MRNIAIMLLVCALGACKDSPTDSGTHPDTTPSFSLHQLPLLGQGAVSERWTAEIAVRDGWAYTTTWGGIARNGLRGDVVKIWSLSGSTPVLTDSLSLTGVGTTSDVQITADGKYLVVSTEGSTAANLNGLAIYDRSQHPEKPTLVTRYANANTAQG